MYWLDEGDMVQLVQVIAKTHRHPSKKYEAAFQTGMKVAQKYLEETENNVRVKES